LEGFPSKENVCNQITDINPSNLVEEQLVYLRSQKIDELYNFGRAGD
jgi:hypothetical protein